MQKVSFYDILKTVKIRQYSRLISAEYWLILLNQLIPARGRKLCVLPDNSSQNRRINSSPQGDGNSALVYSTSPFSLNQLIPARGRKPVILLVLSSVMRNQLIPARGRKQVFAEIGEYSGESTHPRKGTETYILKKLPDLCPGINSSPQGDGNQNHGGSQYHHTESTHPRKGTETRLIIAAAISPLESTHPRKGTETSSCRSHSDKVIQESTHPRKGTETLVQNFLLSSVSNQLIPARGRKLVVRFSGLASPLGINSSPQGDGNLSLLNGGTGLARISSSPQGDGNPVTDAWVISANGINSSPQGDGNLLCLTNQQTQNRINSSPQGDGNYR